MLHNDVRMDQYVTRNTKVLKFRHSLFTISIIIINYFYNAHNTLQGMSLCAVRQKRLGGGGGGGGTVQVHDIIEIIQIGRFLKQS